MSQALALALLSGAAKLCSARAAATQAEVHPHTVPATAPPALGSPHLSLREQTRPGQNCQGAVPHLVGLAAELEPSFPQGLSSAPGAAVRNTSHTGRVMADGQLCVTHLLN